MESVCPDAWDTYFIILTIFFPPSYLWSFFFFCPLQSFLRSHFLTLSKAITKAFPNTIRKLICYCSVLLLSGSDHQSHTALHFSFFAHSSGWVTDVHGLFIGSVLLKIEISVQKGQVLRVRSKWVRLHSSRADDMCCGGGVGVWGRVGNWRGHLACGCVWLRISYWSSAWWMSNRRPDAPHTPHISFTVHFFIPFFSFNVKGEPRRLSSSGSLQLL